MKTSMLTLPLPTGVNILVKSKAFQYFMCKCDHPALGPLLLGFTPPEGGGARERTCSRREDCHHRQLQGTCTCLAPAEAVTTPWPVLCICALGLATPSRPGDLEANSGTTVCDGWISHLGLF